MSSIKTAVNDPVFYLNHCNVDRLWAMWQDYGNQQSYPISGLSFGNNLNDPLWPWDNGKAVPEADRFKDMIRDWNEVFYTNGSMLNYRNFRFCYDEAKGVLLADKTPQKGNFARPYSPSHLYRLEIKTKATYRMYTTGGTDCSLVLFGPANCADCFGAIRASDDNSGEGGINPSISSALFPGLYYVVIKPSHPTITGAYELKCSTRKDQPVELQLNQAFRASLSQMWEIDWYKFTVTQAGNYIIETTGTTDTMMLLYGPNPPEDLIAVDDDSGEDRNALIKRKLDAKTYHVAIRSQRSSVGKYRVIVRT
jgi:tyrosinase